ncbi:hypothetical protein [Rossellomorea aquimaris]|uniref:hypothetical protein n=1 Tax=Rossellomorea aquimaris TaxID=189382 RepID=UPI001CFE9AC7|nr:hypothetical protein [Rossellomorea aquimaris]
MSVGEYELYCVCEEYYKDLRNNIVMNKTPIELARFLSKRLSPLEIEQLLHDIYLIRKRGSSALNYLTLVLLPLLNRDYWMKKEAL